MDNQVTTQQPKVRDSNLELYRILCMLMIVAHHFVVNSGVFASDAPLNTNPYNANSIYLNLFGMWGKTGINCFLMITGYYMCTSKITMRKFVKLLFQIYLYKFVIFGLFFFTGYESLSGIRLAKLFLPVWGFSNNFTGCFIAFYLFIPFLSIMVQNMTKRQHEMLLCLSLGCYTILGSIPKFYVSFNYITWFSIIFIIASYIRLHPQEIFGKVRLWRNLSFVSIILAMFSVIVMQKLSLPYFFVSDSNKVLAVVVAVSTFLWFKNMKLSYSKVVNAIGASTFGVLLIHANSDAMRTWLWKDTIDVVGHTQMPLMSLILYSVGVVVLVFSICIFVDQIRIKIIEKPFFHWFDNWTTK